MCKYLFVFAGITTFALNAKSSYQLLVVLTIFAHLADVFIPVGNGLVTIEILELTPYLDTTVGEPVSKSLIIVFCPKMELLIQKIKKTLKGVKILFIIIKIKLIKFKNNTASSKEKIAIYRWVWLLKTY